MLTLNRLYHNGEKRKLCTSQNIQHCSKTREWYGPVVTTCLRPSTDDTGLWRMHRPNYRIVDCCCGPVAWSMTGRLRLQGADHWRRPWDYFRRRKWRSSTANTGQTVFADLSTDARTVMDFCRPLTSVHTCWAFDNARWHLCDTSLQSVTGVTCTTNSTKSINTLWIILIMLLGAFFLPAVSTFF